MTPRVWTCQRVKAGEKCATVNPRVKRLCELCGKPRPATRKPAHMKALDLSYEEYVEINGGDHCGICGRVRQPGEKRLHREHEHKGNGKPRGLCCWPCNRKLGNLDAVWLRRALAYLERDVPASGVRAVSSPLEDAA